MSSAGELSVERRVSPLRALLEDAEADEILITSFTANLAFFSRAAAGRARSRGARVTLISDLAQTNFDPAAVRGVGVDWLDGRVWCPGAFHPKVIAIGSDERVTVLVGSGNATPAGWVDNAELWVRLDAEHGDCPRTIAAVADWLAALPDVIETSPGVALSCASAAKALHRIEPTYEGPVFVDNLHRPIYEQLPEEKVDELIVSVPFHDPNSRTLSLICEKLRPAHLRVVVQDSYHYDGPALADVVATWNGEVVTNPDTKFHHGKLFEWAGPQGRSALVGSPNCSAAALTKTARETGGNCEVGLVCRIEGPSLSPPGGVPLDAATVASHRYTPPVESGARRPLLVAAVIEEPGTTAVLRIPAPAELVIESYENGTWVDTGHRVPVGHRSYQIVGWWPQRGQALRIPEEDGTATTPVAATQFSRLERRTAVQSEFGGSGGEFVDNPQFLMGLKTLLARVRVSQAQKLGVVAPGQRHTSESDDELPGWQERLDRIRVEGGEHFMWFVLPHLSRQIGTWFRAHPDPPEPPDPPDPPGTEEQEKLDREARLAVYRERRIGDLKRWCERRLASGEVSADEDAARRTLQGLGHDPDSECSEVDICVLAIVLAADALMAWSDPQEEAEILRAALRPLTRPLADEQLAADAASAAAVSLWTLNRLGEEATQPDPIRIIIRTMGPALDPVVSNLEEKGLIDRCEALRTRERPDPPDTAGVFDLVLRLTSPDPWIQGLDLLRQEGRVMLRGQTFVLEDVVHGDGVPKMLRLAVRVDFLAPFAITADTTAAGRVTVAWDGRYLVVLRGGEHPRGEAFLLEQGLVVGISEDSGRPRARDRRSIWYGAESPPSAAAHLLKQVLAT